MELRNVNGASAYGVIDTNNNIMVSSLTSDGSNVALGSKSDSLATDSTSSWSIISLLKGILSKLANILKISQQPFNITSSILQSAAVANGNGTDFNVAGNASVIISFTDNFVGTLTFLGSADGNNFSTTSLFATQLGSRTTVNSFTGTNSGNVYLYELSVSALSKIRVPISNYVSGSITINAYAAPVTLSPRNVISSPANGNNIPQNPAIPSGSNATLVAANPSRIFLNIVNGTNGTILLGLAGQTLTGLTPSPTNPGFPLLPQQGYEFPSHYVPTNAITVWQSSGSTTSLISVTEK